MYYRRTSARNKDVISAGTTNSTTPRCRSLWIAAAVIALLMSTGPVLLAQPVDGPDDGLTAEERSAIQSEVNEAPPDFPAFRAIVIVDSTARNAIFGMYQLRSMTQPGWDLFGRTIEWAIDHKAHAATRIWLATYDGTLNPENGAEISGFLAYEYLVDSMGFNPDSIQVGSQWTIDDGDFTGYDLVLQISAGLRNAENVLDQGIPFVTLSVDEAAMMNLGTGDVAISKRRDSVWIQDVDHEITSPLEPGLVFLQQEMWIRATYASGNGVVLVSIDSTYYQPPVAITIGLQGHVEFGDVVTIDVTLDRNSYWFDMAGFDLLLDYDTSLLELVSVSQGGLLDSCGWEYFDYRLGSETDCGDQPCQDGFIRLVGVADIASVPGSPTCYADTTGTLARLEFHVSSDSANNCSRANIRFRWHDCGDNILSSIAGDSLFVSEGVYSGSVPSLPGTPDTCLTDNPTMFRRVDYHNGWVLYECIPPPVSPGDVNLNFVPFEIADWVLFTNYFVHGLDVFNINIQHQIRESDVNVDSVPLTLQDLMYMYSHVHTGPEVPHHPPDPSDTVLFSQDAVAKTVSLSYPDTIQAVYLVFEGHLKPWGEETWAYDGQYTRILIGPGMWPWGDSTIFEQDSLFYYTGEGSFLAAYAAADGYTAIPTAIVGSAGDCCQNKGNINDDPSGELDIADLVFLVEYMFAEGPEPPCTRQADIIEDWSIDMADLVFLVDYMFNGGPAAPPCP